AAMVRIPVGEFATASRALDFGAEGIIAPMINTPADARAYVSFAKFPPLGERSWGPHRATTLANMADQKVYLREANALTVTFAMIETRTALDNVEAIAATPGIDALFLGPADLSIALSNGAEVDPMSPKVDRELDRIMGAAHKAGKVMGAYCHSVERAAALAKRGVRFLAVGSDMGVLRAGAGGGWSARKGCPRPANRRPANPQPSSAQSRRAPGAVPPRPPPPRPRARDSRAPSATCGARRAPSPRSCFPAQGRARSPG